MTGSGRRRARRLAVALNMSAMNTMGPGRRRARRSAAAALRPSALSGRDRDGDEHDDQPRRHSVASALSGGTGTAISTTILSGGGQVRHFRGGTGDCDYTIVHSGGSAVIFGGTLRLTEGAGGDRLPRGFGRHRGHPRSHRRRRRVDFHEQIHRRDSWLDRGGRRSCAHRRHRRHRFGGRRGPCRLDPERRLRNAASRRGEQKCVLESMTLDGIYYQSQFTADSSIRASIRSPTIPRLHYVGSGAGVSGSASGITIVSGGIQYIGYDRGTGTQTSTTISNGGIQYVGVEWGNRDGDRARRF